MTCLGQMAALVLLAGCCLASGVQRDYSPCDYLQNLNGQWEIVCDNVTAPEALDAFRRNSGNAAVEILVLGNIPDMTDAVLGEILGLVASDASQRLTRMNLYNFPRLRAVPSFRSFANLNYLYFYYMDGVEDLPAGSMSFTSNHLVKIFCAHSNIRRIDPAAFQGDFRGTEIYLYFNAMTSLDPSVFKPLLTTATVTITDSNSIDIFTFIHFIHFIHFNLDGYFDSDPIVCDCNLAWIIRDNPQLLDQLTAFCTDTDGSRINVHFLDPNRFKNC